MIVYKPQGGHIIPAPSSSSTTMTCTGGRRKPFPLLVLLFLLASAGLSASQPTGESSSSSDGRALLSFKSLISDPSGALSSTWGNTSLHFCQWRGVNCSDVVGGADRRVTALELHSLDLAGKLSPSLANLTFLQTLNLNGNSLSGSIPRELASLSNLLHLDLAGNLLEGAIPGELGFLSELQSVSLSNNRLTGSIPPSIGNLSNLRVAVFSFNHLSGSIPAAVGNLSSLIWLDLNTNRLKGAIPPSIGNLPRLAYLDLHINQLNGTISSEIGNLSSLRSLFLGTNQFTGTVPRSLGSLKSLDALSLRHNMLEAGNAADWGFMDALTNCTVLRVLILESNKFGGMLPKSVANLSRFLTMLRLDDNQIAGSIPPEIVKLVNLTTFNLSSNLLSGAIPAALGSISALVSLDLGRNRFVGEIPSTLGDLHGLTSLIMSFNQLNGSIPPSLGGCPLNTLSLESNKLTGRVPKEILSITSLSIILNISHNSLTGTLPSEIGNLRNIPTIDVSYNQLSGEIPSSLSGCQILQNLYMQGNNFQGTIPSSFSQLKGLQVLDVSRNNLSGSIPDFLLRFHSMTHIDLSYNHFSGELPEDGVFADPSAFSVVGNKNLCGGVPELNLQPCSASKKHHMSAEVITIISVAGGILLCLILLGSLFAARYNWLCKSKRDPNSDAVSCVTEQRRQVSFDGLLKATDGFSPANLIGTGSFGSVYKGTMDWEDHKVVAVKVLNLQQRGALRSFMAECEALRYIRHRNLVKILTSCSSIDFQGTEFRALVFEFLQNGSLDKWLHPEVGEGNKIARLDLLQRLNISIDIASALEYLHHHGTIPIIHCDLKPSNVLLDCDLVAHVGDFGLAKFLTSNEGSTTSVTLRGSIGYVAPEYGMNSKVSTQGDAYSYGILVLELFTGKRPTNDTFNNELNLHKYVQMALPHRVVEVTDPKLLLEGEIGGQKDHADLSTNESRMRAVECITSILRVGISCSKDSPKERMDMEDATRELQNIRDAFLS